MIIVNNDEGKLSGNKEHLVWSYDKQNWTRFSDDDLRVTKETNIFIKKRILWQQRWI